MKLLKIRHYKHFIKKLFLKYNLTEVEDFRNINNNNFCLMEEVFEINLVINFKNNGVVKTFYVNLNKNITVVLYDLECIIIDENFENDAVWFMR